MTPHQVINMALLHYVFLLFVFAFPGLSEASQQNLEDVGKGEIRFLGFIKLYDANLLAPPDTPRNAILNADVSRCLILEYDVSLDAADLISGGETVLSKQHDREKLNSIRNHIDTLHRSYSNVSSGDSYSLCYDSTYSVTTLSLNSQHVVSIQSSDFASVYFGIWLGPMHPINSGLRDQLLKNLPVDG